MKNRSKKQDKPVVVAAPAPVAPKVEAPAVKVKREVVKVEAARKAVATDKLVWLVSANPKRPGAAAHARASAYWGSKTVGEYVTNGGSRADLNYDADHGFLTIE